MAGRPQEDSGPWPGFPIMLAVEVAGGGPGRADYKANEWLCLPLLLSF